MKIINLAVIVQFLLFASGSIYSMEGDMDSGPATLKRHTSAAHRTPQKRSKSPDQEDDSPAKRSTALVLVGDRLGFSSTSSGEVQPYLGGTVAIPRGFSPQQVDTYLDDLFRTFFPDLHQKRAEQLGAETIFTQSGTIILGSRDGGVQLFLTTKLADFCIYMGRDLGGLAQGEDVRKKRFHIFVDRLNQACLAHCTEMTKLGVYSKSVTPTLWERVMADQSLFPLLEVCNKPDVVTVQMSITHVLK